MSDGRRTPSPTLPPEFGRMRRAGCARHAVCATENRPACLPRRTTPGRGQAGKVSQKTPALPLDWFLRESSSRLPREGRAQVTSESDDTSAPGEFRLPPRLAVVLSGFLVLRRTCCCAQ